MMDSENKELQDMEKMAHLLSIRTLIITFCVLSVVGVIYFFIMKYFFHDSYKECNDVTCAILCDVCDIEARETEESWISAGTFGDMYGCLTCLFTGLSVVGLLINLILQRRQLEAFVDDYQFNKSLSFKTFVVDNMKSAASFMNETQYEISLSKKDGERGISKYSFPEFARDFISSVTDTMIQLNRYVSEGQQADDTIAALSRLIKHINKIRRFADQSYWVLCELYHAKILNEDERVGLDNYFRGILGENSYAFLIHAFVAFRMESPCHQFDENWGKLSLLELLNLLFDYCYPDICLDNKIAILAIYCESLQANAACIQVGSDDEPTEISLPKLFDMPTYKQVSAYKAYASLYNRMTAATGQ